MPTLVCMCVSVAECARGRAKPNLYTVAAISPTRAACAAFAYDHCDPRTPTWAPRRATFCAGRRPFGCGSRGVPCRGPWRPGRVPTSVCPEGGGHGHGWFDADPCAPDASDGSAASQRTRGRAGWQRTGRGRLDAGPRRAQMTARKGHFRRRRCRSRRPPRHLRRRCPCHLREAPPHRHGPQRARSGRRRPSDGRARGCAARRSPSTHRATRPRQGAQACPTGCAAADPCMCAKHAFPPMAASVRARGDRRRERPSDRRRRPTLRRSMACHPSICSSDRPVRSRRRTRAGSRRARADRSNRVGVLATARKRSLMTGTSNALSCPRPPTPRHRRPNIPHAVRSPDAAL